MENAVVEAGKELTGREKRFRLTDEQVLVSARMYLMGESYKAIDEYLGRCGLSQATDFYLRSRLFVMACATVKDEAREYLNNKAGAIESRALEEIAERIENGDEVLLTGPDGETLTRRRKLRARELAAVMEIVANRREVVAERMERMREGGKEDAVRALAEKLHRYVQEKEINGEAKEVGE